MDERGNHAAVGPYEFAIEDGEWTDRHRCRCLRWKRYRPHGIGGSARVTQTPLVIYSHGLGGSCGSGEAWARHWASWGVGTLAVQHPGTDEGALAGNSPLALRHLLRTAVDKAQLAARQADLRFALDRAAAETPTAAFGIAGHSYGAVSALRLIGERRGNDDLPADPRLLAAVLFSPSARGGSLPLNERFGNIATPCLHLTGSADDGIGPGDINATDRCLPYRHSPGPGQHLLVLDGAGHLSFAGQGHGSEAHIRLLRAASTAFWLAHLTDDRKAADWLGTMLQQHLASGDRLKSK